MGFQFFNSLFKFILLVPSLVSIGIKTQNVAYVIKIIFINICFTILGGCVVFTGFSLSFLFFFPMVDP